MMDKEFIAKIKTDFPELIIRDGKKFAFRPPKTVMVGPEEDFWKLLLLHEVAHAVLRHKTFRLDAERLKMEAAAWDKATELAKIYGIEIDEDFAQNQLDTYRDWLHKKSRCPKCGLTRFQTPDGQYSCPRCDI
ncbi:TFIIB-type zinc finger domain-containing protein [Candidatus Saccharibacteria bacterium]|nr:TFIIB-type zinc finger domain-containing protein [Candidatus Saccharibacteria bacterium]